MSDLRNELLGRRTPAMPPFRMLLPSGWLAFDLSEENEDRVISQGLARLAASGNGGMSATIGPMLRDAFASLRRQNGFAYAIPGEAAPTWAVGPASIIGLKRASTPEVTLDDVVMHVVAEFGAAPLGGDERILAWAETRTVTVQGEQARALTLNYLIPIPGTRRTQAVQWTVTTACAPDLPEDAPGLQQWKLLFDVHMATFAWVQE
ncbi:hypothetical protein [Microbacterium azadirachtae]|nr:hypothetical protein [Microbacterium azadirachtae]